MQFREPYGDEALPGYVVECAAAYAAHPTGLLEAAECPLSVERVPFLCADEGARLAYLLSQNPQAVADKTYQKLRRDGDIPLIQFHGMSLRRSHLLTSRRRLAPASMRESNYIRALSIVSPIDFCPQSWTELTDHCLHCGKYLVWADLPHVSVFHRCGADQRDFETRVVPEELRDELDAWVNLIHPAPEVQHNAVGALPVAIRTLGSGAVFDLVLGLAGAIHGPEAGLKGIAAGMAAARAWPESIIEALAGDNAQIGDRDPLTSRLRRYASLPMTLPPIRNLLLYDLARYRGVALGAKAEIEREIRRLNGFSVREAAQFLSIAPVEVSRLRRAGVLNVTTARRGRMSRELLIPGSCFTAREHLADRMSICEFISATGLSEHAVEELLSAGRLSRLENPAIEALFERPVLVRTIAEHFIEQLRLSVTPLGHDDDDYILLKDAFKAVGGRPKPYVALFDMIFKDRCGIRAYVSADGSVDLTRLYVSPMILHTLAKLDSNFASTKPVSRAVAREILNCRTADIELLVKLRALTLVREEICADSIKSAARALISLEEINARLGYHERGALGWLKRQNLHEALPGFVLRKALDERLGAHIPLGTWRRHALGLSIQDMIRGRGDLSAREWENVRGWYPRQRKSSNGICDRRVTNAAIWLSATGRNWKDIPKRYGEGSAYYARYRQLRNTGALDRIVTVLNRDVRRSLHWEVGPHLI